MSDLSSQLNQILSDPNMMEQIRSLSGLFGQSAGLSDSHSEQAVSENISLPQSTPSPSPFDLIGSDGIQTAMKLMPILSELKHDDDTIKLLRSIKPFLSPQRQDKLEEAIKLLRIIRIIPLLKNQGLGNLF